MKKLHSVLAFVLASAGSGPLTAQTSPGEIVEYPDTSLTACPTPNSVIDHFYYAVDNPVYRGATWCGAPQSVIAHWNAVGTSAPYVLEECQPGQYWRYSMTCEGIGCDGSGR